MADASSIGKWILNGANMLFGHNTVTFFELTAAYNSGWRRHVQQCITVINASHHGATGCSLDRLVGQ